VKIVAAAVAALVAAAVPNPPTDVEINFVTSCADVPRLPAPTVAVFDPSPPVYALPESNVLEPGVVVRDGGLEYTFADQGESVPVLCPGSDTEYYQVRTFTRVSGSGFPRCSKYVVETERTGDCAPVPSLYDPSPDDAPTPDIDPDFDEHSPEGPGPGPPGATTVDKP
jgi:hypothetical protein